LSKQADVQDLIKGARQGQSKKEKEFFLYANKIIWNEAPSILKNFKGNLFEQEFLLEDVCNDIFLKIYQQIKREPYITIRHPAAYIKKVTINYCHKLTSQKNSLEFRDLYQKKETEPKTKEEIICEYYEQSFSLELREGIERVVSYLASFYEVKIRLEELIVRDERPFLLYNRFTQLEKDIKRIMEGHMPSKEEIQRQFYLQSLDKKTEEQLKELHAFPDKYGFFLSLVYLHFYKSKKYLEHEARVNDPEFSSGLIPEPTESNIRKIELWSDFITYMPKMKADPANLFFLVLDKIDKIKRGSYRDHKKINLIFTYQKLNTAGTENAFLFDSINPGIRKSTADIKRKAAYKKKLKSKYYQDLIDFIYEKSFKDKISPFHKLNKNNQK